MKPELRIGIARRDISYQQPELLKPSGMGRLRRTIGVLDPLYFEAMAISTGEETAFLLSGDIIDFPYPWVQRIRDTVAKETGCDPQKILFSCNHNHCSSPTPWDKSDEAKAVWEAANELVITSAIETCREAWSGIRPAEVGTVTVELPRAITQNRRFRMSSGTCINHWGAGAIQPFGQKLVEPAGDDNTRVDAFCVREPGQEAPFAVFISYASHQHFYEVPYFSGEFVGGAKRALAERLPGCVIMQSSHACGDLDIHCTHPMPDEHEAQVKWFQDSQRTLAAEFADAVAPAIKAASYSRPATLRHQYVSTEDRPTEAQKPSYILNHLCLGDIAFVSFPGEVSFEYAQRLWAESPLPRLILMAYNGSGGVGMYWPTERQYEEGSYEVMRGPDYKRPEYGDPLPTEEIYQGILGTLKKLAV